MRIRCFEKVRVLQTVCRLRVNLFGMRVDKHCELWMEGALRQLFSPANDNYDFPSAERLAIAKEFSEQSLALNPPDAVLREG
ncbi:hypothetical protein ABH995_001089 [Bradyrhizobium yuanmingense]